MSVKLVVLLSTLLAVSIGTNIYLLKKINEQTFVQGNLYKNKTNNVIKQNDNVANNESLTPLVADNKLAVLANNYQENNKQSAEINLLIAKAEQLFFANQFIAAIDHLEQIAMINKTSSDLVNEQWLAVGKQWILNRKFSLLSSFLQAYLARFPLDEQWLQLKIDWLVAVNKPDLAMTIYYQLIANAFNRDKEESWSHQAHQLFQHHIKTLKNQKSWQSIINFSKPLIVNDIDYPPYQLALAEAYIHLNEIETAINYLENIKYGNNYTTQINALNTLIDSIVLADEGIKLTQQGQHYIVEAILNNQHTAQLMIDTGASLTVISTAFYQKLLSTDNIKTKRKLNINTAGGNETAFSITIDEFWLAGRAVYDFEVVVMDLNNFDKADGLLGMNFLQHFKFEIDQKNALLFLTPH
ncbi:retropepsin-like aspartic protease [Thalassotalea psychrophila]|uniref:Retropepsin-like aspartic protease n=1 Tax=Thalassotalea psychrophila TaxID=3065647 RepID=A0ABY9TQ66_9GAMM|nr:retropepsin-like aspartic protease [Colwelliaceae bacterium SQ149]